MKFLTVVPAYGRDYKSQREVKQAYQDGKDFQIASIGPDCGRYINRADAEREKGSLTLNIRYDRNRKVLPIKV